MFDSFYYLILFTIILIFIICFVLKFRNVANYKASIPGRFLEGPVFYSDLIYSVLNEGIGYFKFSSLNLNIKYFSWCCTLAITSNDLKAWKHKVQSKTAKLRVNPATFLSQKTLNVAICCLCTTSSGSECLRSQPFRA